MTVLGEMSPNSSDATALTSICPGLEPNLNQSDCYVADEDHPAFFVFFGITIDVIVLIGLTGNAASIYVFSRPDMKSSFNLHLLVLAGFDIGVLATSFITHGVDYMCYWNMSLKTYNTIVLPSMMPFFVPSFSVALTGSIWMTFVISIERFLVVVYPLRAKTLCTYKRAVISVISVTVLAICFNIPLYFIHRTVSYVNPTSGEMRVYLVPMCLVLDVAYIAYDTWVWLFAGYLIPLAIIAILNAKIYWEIRRSHRKFNPNGRNRNETKLALMLVVVVLAFCILNIPEAICYFVSRREILISKEVRYLTFLLTVSNSAVNFFIYCMFSRTFRVYLVQRLRLCVDRKCLSERAEYTSSSTQEITL